MRLTDSMRSAFVRAAMQDVPSIDYPELIRFEAMKAVVEALPPSVRAVWTDPKTKPYVETCYRSFGDIVVADLPGYGSRYDDDSQEPKLPAKTVKRFDELVAAHEKQTEEREALELKLKGAARSCTTRAGLAKLLPEFERYLPPDEEAALRTLPVVANIVADFTRAGWPKDKAKAKKAKAAS